MNMIMTPEIRPISRKNALLSATAKETSIFLRALTKPCEDADVLVGEVRLRRAVQLGILSNNPLGNIALAGLHGPDAGNDVAKLLRQELAYAGTVGGKQWLKESRHDVLYVYNFQDKRAPLSLSLPRGSASEFKKAVESLYTVLKKEIPLAVNSDEVLAVLEERANEFNEWAAGKRKAFLAKIAEQHPEIIIDGDLFSGEGKLLFRNTTAENGQTLCYTKEEFAALPDEEQARLHSTENRVWRSFQKLFAAHKKKHEDYERDVAAISTNALKKTIENIFADPTFYVDGNRPREGPIAKFFAGLQTYALEHHAQFTEEKKKGNASDELPWKDRELPWKVNIFTTESGDEKLAPVIFADPSLHNLVGWIEYSPISGGDIYTNHMKIIPGALAKANGGFLIMNADELIRAAHVWDILKQIVRARKFSFRPLIALGFLPPQMDPFGIDLGFRVVFYGTHEAFEILQKYDSEFATLFPAYAEHSLYLARDEKGIRALGKLIAARVRERGLLPLSRSGAGALIEYACREAEHQHRFSSDVEKVVQLYDEAHCHALSENAEIVGRKNIEVASQNRHARANVFEEHLQNAVREKTILITIEGVAVGQVNALEIQQGVGEPFGFPFRMTAVSSMGEFNLANAHRSAGLSGNISEKADETVLGLFKSLFGQEFLLAADISISFEQTYDGIEGDSASLAEFYAILSSVAQIPIRQSFAITGSVNLHGDIQPVGGVNEKIEGFFDTCASLGTVSGQAVLIPHQNLKHLMLRRDVVEAIRSGAFAVYPISTLAEGAELLMNSPYEDIIAATKERLFKFFCLANAEINFSKSGDVEEPVA